MKRPKNNPVPFNISQLEHRSIGKLRMTMIDPGKAFGTTLLHEYLPPRSSAPYMVHDMTSEFVYVLSGRAVGLIDGTEVRLRAGDCLTIPPGTPHLFSTRGSAVEALSIFNPPIDPARPDARMLPAEAEK